MLRIGLLLSFVAVFLQIAVFLQPLLPKQYQIAPVCETITRALFSEFVHSSEISQSQQHATAHVSTDASQHSIHAKHTPHEHAHGSIANTEHALSSVTTSQSHHQSVAMAQHLPDTHAGHDHHDANHQCQYCTVLGHLVLPPEVNLEEILIRIQVRLIALQKAYQHVYFALQRLFLIPQGRAPPLFS